MLIRDDASHYLSPSGRAYAIEVEPVGDKQVRARLIAEPTIPNTAMQGLETIVPLGREPVLRWAWPPFVLRPRVEVAIERLLSRADRLEARFGKALQDLPMPAPAPTDEGPKLTNADIGRLADELDRREAQRLQDMGMSQAEDEQEG